MQKAVVLFSGGLDSTTLLYHAKNRYNVHALVFDYGQHHRIEVDVAKIHAQMLDVPCKVVDLPLNHLLPSALTANIPKHKNRGVQEILTSGVPSTYVPGRNMIFLSVAAAYAEAIGASRVYIGVNSLDTPGYPDCSQDFILRAQDAFNVTNPGLVIAAPLVTMSKVQIVELGCELGVRYELTSSCYEPQEGGKPCKVCDSCVLRAQAFRQAGKRDPLEASFLADEIPTK